MKVSVKSAPKKFEPKTLEITVESFSELKELRDGFGGRALGCVTPMGRLSKIINDLYKDALDKGEVDYDF